MVRVALLKCCQNVLSGLFYLSVLWLFIEEGGKIFLEIKV